MPTESKRSRVSVAKASRTTVATDSPRTLRTLVRAAAGSGWACAPARRACRSKESPAATRILPAPTRARPGYSPPAVAGPRLGPTRRHPGPPPGKGLGSAAAAPPARGPRGRADAKRTSLMSLLELSSSAYAMARNQRRTRQSRRSALCTRDAGAVLCSHRCARLHSLSEWTVGREWQVYRRIYTGLQAKRFVTWAGPP